jgi:hypothetical protein
LIDALIGEAPFEADSADSAKIGADRSKSKRNNLSRSRSMFSLYLYLFAIFADGGNYCLSNVNLLRSLIVKVNKHRQIENRNIKEKFCP